MTCHKLWFRVAQHATTSFDYFGWAADLADNFDTCCSSLAREIVSG